jgi:hypothetical protein
VWGEYYEHVDDEVGFYAIAPRELEKLNELIEAYGSLDEEWANPLPIIEILRFPSGTNTVGMLVSMRTATGKVWEMYPWACRIEPDINAKWIPEGSPFAVRSTKIDTNVPENYAYPCPGEGGFGMAWHYPMD